MPVEDAWSWIEKHPTLATIISILAVAGVAIAWVRSRLEDVDAIGKSTGFTPPWSRARRDRRGRRRDLARYLRKRVDHLAADEDWARNPYTELEVEVEPGDRHRRARLARLVPRRRRLRRRKSLTSELKRGEHELILVKGEPGSGKSFALRHLALEMATSAVRSRRVRAVIPVYVNLKSLDGRGKDIDGALIESFVLQTLKKGGGPEIEATLEGEDFMEFRQGMREGGWLFLFDSFDELPEVLGAVEVNRKVEEYSEAIEGFAAGHPCRVIVASRLFKAPRARGWATFRIVPLSDERKTKFIRRAKLTGTKRGRLLDDLPTAQPDVAALASNPLFLALLCQYVRFVPDLPTYPHEVFDDEIDRRIGDVESRLLEEFGVGKEQTLSHTREVAYTMPAAGLGLEPSRCDLLAAMPSLRFAADERTVSTLDALESEPVRLARGEGERGEDPFADVRTFTFSHRRFQEYFATLLVRDDRERVSVDLLLSDAQWRETAVTLCQTRPEAVRDLLDAARRRLAVMVGELPPAPGFAWPRGALHVLGLLQSAFGNAPERLDAGVRNLAGRIVEAAWQGEDDDRKLALEVVGIAPDPVKLSLLGAGLRSNIQALSETAYRQVARMPEVPSGLEEEMRRALVEMAASGRLRRERHAVRAQIKRLRGSEQLLRAVRVLLWVPVVDACVHLAAAAAIVSLIARVELAIYLVAMAAVLAYSWRLLPQTERALARWRPRSATGGEAVAGPQGSPFTSGLLLRAYAMFGTYVLVAGATGAFAALFVPIAYGFTWSAGAVLAVIRGRMMGFPGILLPQPLALSRIRLRGVGLAVLAAGGGGLVGLAILAAGAALFGVMPAEGDIVAGSLLGLAFAAFLVYIVWTVARTSGHDRWWYLTWRYSPSDPLTPLEFLETLGTQRTTAGLVRVVADVRDERLLAPSEESEQVVRDLMRAARRPVTSNSDAADEPRIDNDDVRRWLDENREKRLELLRTAGTELRQELIPLVEDVRMRRQELPSA